MAEPEEKPEFPKKGNQGEEKPIKDKISNRFEELKKTKTFKRFTTSQKPTQKTQSPISRYLSGSCFFSFNRFGAE
jgi:hypothetical protein